MEFKKFQHVERFGSAAVVNVDDGTCHIFPKLDGANGSIWLGADEDDQPQIFCGSRNMELDAHNTNKGFYNWVQKNKEILMKFFTEHPTQRLFGEWLVPHTIKYYFAEAFNKFYVFDVMNSENKYISYEEYCPVLERLGIDFIPRLAVVNNPTQERIHEIAANDTFLLPDGKPGEGVVIKNYEYRDRYGHQLWSKIITSEKMIERAKCIPKTKEDAGTTAKTNKLVEEKIIEEYVTDAFLEKTQLQVMDDAGEEEFNTKLIPILFNKVYDTLIFEDSYNFICKFNNPIINFKKLQGLSIARTKQHFKIGK